jgi:hypothetical protein
MSENYIFIPNTNERYSISKNGIVVSNFKFKANGEKNYRKLVIKPRPNTKKCKSPIVHLQFGNWSLKNKMKRVFLTTLMQECFNLQPPDKSHFYDLIFKDGNYLNASLDNLIYKIRMDSNTEYKFYPQPIYDQNGKITHKICANCGNEKEITSFHLQQPKQENQNRTYRNICEKCRSKKQWATIKADEKKLARHKLHTKEWTNSEDGKKYFKQYHKLQRKYDFDNITPRYIAENLSMLKKDLTPTIIEISRKKTLLLRAIKNEKN